MLIGEYIHTIDQKNRISLPSKFRKLMGEKLVITPGLEECLFLFTQKEWVKVTKKLSSGEGELSFLRADQRSFNRYMFGRASEVEVDSVGRILLPDFLKEKIGIKESAVFVGVEDRVEIWNETSWKTYKQKVEREAGQLAEKLSVN